MNALTANTKHSILTSKNKPPRTVLNPDNIPEAMKWERRWLNWRWQWKVNKSGVGKWDKPPLRTNGSNGDATDPNAWVSFDEALAAFNGNKTFDGIGFALGDGWTGVDIDDCRNPEDSAVSVMAESIMQSFQSYTEISPSGTGVKIFLHGQKPEGACSNKAEGLEVYSRGRYFTVTGCHVEETPLAIATDNGSLAWLQRSYLDNLRDVDVTITQRITDETNNIELAREAILHIPACYASDYRDWVRVAYAAKNTDDSLRDAWVAWSRYGHGYADDDDCKATWKKIKPSGKLGIGTLVHLAKESGWQPERKMHSSVEATHEQAKAASPKAELVPVRIVPVSVRNLIRDNSELRPVIVDGILRRGETANIIAAAKVGKSFLALFLAWCIALGRSWLSHDVTQGKVLIIDNELHPETLANRLYRIGDRMGVDPQSDAYQNIDVISLRGLNVDIHALEMRLAAIEPGTYTLAIVDALYRTLPAGTSENDNAAMMAIYNRLDHLAIAWDAAIAVVHHSSKGAQGDKSVTDVGSGAGAISRAADTHIVIRQHEDPELCVLETVTRSFKSPEPVSIRFTWPLWEAVTTAPEVKRVGQRRDEKTAQDDKEADKVLLDAIQTKALSESQLVRTTGMGPSRVSRAIGRAVKAKTIKSKNVKRQGRKVAVYVATATATATAESDPCM